MITIVPPGTLPLCDTWNFLECFPMYMKEKLFHLSSKYTLNFTLSRTKAKQKTVLYPLFKLKYIFGMYQLVYLTYLIKSLEMDKDGFNSMLKHAQKLINQTLKFSIILVIMLLYINKKH